MSELTVKEANATYYKKNRERLLKYSKDRYEANRDDIKTKRSEAYWDNRNDILEKKNERINCPHCDREISVNNKAQHMRTKRCQNHGMTEKEAILEEWFKQSSIQHLGSSPHT